MKLRRQRHDWADDDSERTLCGLRREPWMEWKRYDRAPQCETCEDRMFELMADIMLDLDPGIAAALRDKEFRQAVANNDLVYEDGMVRARRPDEPRKQ